MRKNKFVNVGSVGQNDCCVCGSEDCFESLDHSRVTKQDLRCILKRIKGSQQQVESMKQRVNEAYIWLRNIITTKIDMLHRKSLEWLNRLQVQDVQKYKINVDILSQLIEENYSCLPYKKLDKMVEKLKNYVPHNQPSKTFHNVKTHFQQYISKLNQINILTQVQQYCFIPQLINLNQWPQLKSNKSSFQNPQSIAPLPNYNWRNVFINSQTKSVSLSNKSITDLDMIQQISSIAVYKNIEELEIRYNRITPITCSLIASNLYFLSAVDVRGNKVGDEGVIKIIQGIRNLKSLMVSETGITDLSAKQIEEGLPQLEMLWSENTFLTQKHVFGIACKPKLRVLSLSGNQIKQQLAGLIKRAYGNKGYIAL